MGILVVTYDLGGKDKDYNPLFEAIKSNSNSWWHYITDTWLVQTPKTASEYSKLLLPHIDEEADVLFVAEITKNNQGWLPREAWKWIREKEKK